MFLRHCPSCGGKSPIDAKKLVDEVHCEKCRDPLPPPPHVLPATMKDLRDASEYQKVPILALFTGERCAMSQAILKYLPKSAEKFVGKALIFEIKVELNPDAVQLIRGTPTVMLGKRGTHLHTHEGFAEQSALDGWIREAQRVALISG